MFGGGGSLVSLARGFGHCGMRVARCTTAPYSPWRSAPGAKGWELGHDQACAPHPWPRAHTVLLGAWGAWVAGTQILAPGFLRAPEQHFGECG